MGDSINKLILGTVQMGLSYGVNNSLGKITLKESHEILLKAHMSGITTLDTAEAYGNAHKVIGKFHENHHNHRFKIITKVPYCFEEDNVEDNIEDKIKGYLKDLNVDHLETLMFHGFESFKRNQGALVKLLKLKSVGLVKHIGVSVYTNSELEYLLDKDYITVVQLPFNLIDNYSLRGDLLEELKLRGKVIHTRSVFLQRLFFKKTNDENKVVQKLQTELKIIHEIAEQSNCSIEALALSYCLYQKNIDGVIIGVDSEEHLRANMKASLHKIEKEIIRRIDKIQVEDVDLLNPAKW